MPVVKRTFSEQKWKIPVPYALDTGVPDDRSDWIKGFNSLVGFDLFVKRSLEEAKDEPAWIKIVQEAHSHSAIGRQGGMQIVSVNPANADGSDKQQTLFHELGHALGFCHEQLHSGYPLDNVEVLRELLAPESGETEFTIDEMVKSLEFNQNSSFGPCDFSSMMMYGRFRRAARKVDASIEDPLAMLSKYDVLIINNLYRKNQKPLSIDLPDLAQWCKKVRLLIVEAKNKVPAKMSPKSGSGTRQIKSKSGANEEGFFTKPKTRPPGAKEV
jgi:hypothetical protein